LFITTCIDINTAPDL